MYDALHMGILKKFEDDEKHMSENVDWIVKDDKSQEIILTDWDTNIVMVISMILGEGSRSRAFDLIKLLSRDKHITFNENNIITHLKTDMKTLYEFIQAGVQKGTDTIQSFMIKKLDYLRKFFSYQQSQYEVPFF